MTEEELRNRQALAALMNWTVDQVHDMLDEEERVTEMLRQHLPRREERDAVLSEFFCWLKDNAPGFLDAVVDNTQATAAVLARLGTELGGGGPAFHAAAEVLEEGAALRLQLGVGRLGTTSAEPGFDKAARPGVSSGLELLAA